MFFSMNTSDRVKKLYARYYPKSKGLPAGRHIALISQLIEDPLLWVWLTNPAAATRLKGELEEVVLLPQASSPGSKDDECISERLRVFEASLKNNPPDFSIASKSDYDDHQKRSLLFQSILATEGDLECGISKFVRANKSDSQPSVDTNLSPLMLGVILDLYPTVRGSWKGYVGSFPIKDEAGRLIAASKTVKFDGRSPAVKLVSIPSYPLHIGDEVSFRCNERGSVAEHTLEVTRYNSVEPIAFFSEYASALRKWKDSPLQSVQNLLDWPAPWKCMLEEERLYKSLYRQMLEIGVMCNAAELKVDSRARSAFISTLIESSFVQKVVGVLTKQEMSNEIVSYLVQLLTTLVRRLNKDEAYQWAKPLKQLAAILEERNNTRAMKLLLDAVLDCCLVPPSSTKPTKECWSSIPTILTSSEFDDAVQPDAGMEASSNLPVVKHTYDSIEEYGQTYFTLLREDCYRELTNAVARMKSGKTDDQKDTYYQMQFSHLYRDNIHIVYGFHFKTVVSSASKHCLEDFPLLKQGNLVCFSSKGRFEGEDDIVWGTVSKVENIRCEKTTKTVS